MTTRRSVLQSGIGALAAAAFPAVAQDKRTRWPTKPLSLVVGGPAGGGSDAVARPLAAQLSEVLGQPVIVVNKTGAGGVLAADTVSKAGADGSTLILLTSAHASQAATLKSLPYDSLKGFAWISSLGTYPLVIAVGAQSPLRNIADLIREAKKDPGKLSYGSAGVGTTLHLVGEWFCAEAHISLNHIPYKDNALFTDVLAGRVDMMVMTANAVLPQYRSGAMRVLAASSAQRYSLMPEVPTIAETIQGFEIDSWLALAAPAATPPDTVEKVNAALNQILQSPQFERQLLTLGITPKGSTPNALRITVDRNIQLFRQIATSRGIDVQKS